MIGRLTGTLAEVRPDFVLMDVGGVGYEVFIPLSTHAQLPAPGEIASLRVYTHVREDTLQLFGFFLSEEKALFERLLAVSGVGPRLALAVLSGLSVFDFVNAISAKNTALLTTIPGVGKKLAERLALELKDKLTGIHASSQPARPAVSGPPPGQAAQDAVAVLEGLGYKQSQAETAVATALRDGSARSLESLVQKALQSLAPPR